MEFHRNAWANKLMLTLSQTTNFRFFQTERAFRQQFQICLKMAESSPKC